jgi:hypothetical protein
VSSSKNMSSKSSFEDDEYLNSIAVALRARAKPIRHKSVLLTTKSAEDMIDGATLIGLDASVQKKKWKAPLFKMVIWSDRWIWLDGRELEKNRGWIWKWTDEGRISGLISSADLVVLFEKSVDLTSDSKTVVSRLEELWSPFLHKGPDRFAR